MRHTRVGEFEMISRGASDVFTTEKACLTIVPFFTFPKS